MTEQFEYDKEDWEVVIKDNKEIDFIVSENQFNQILNEVGDSLDEDGFIIDSKTKLRELSKDEDEIRLKQLGGLLTGSKVFIKPNIASFSQHLIEKKLHKPDND